MKKKAMGEEAQLVSIQDTTSSEQAISIYNDVLERTQNAEIAVQKEKDAYMIWDGYEHLRKMLQSHMVAIITGCEVFGIFIIVMARRDKAMKNWAGVSLCIILPLIMVALVYLIPLIKTIFV
jgi:Ca2+/Na+ antiporter